MLSTSHKTSVFEHSQRHVSCMFTFSYTKHVKFIFIHATFVSIINKWHSFSFSCQHKLFDLQVFTKHKEKLQAMCRLFRQIKTMTVWQSIFLNTDDEKLSVSFPLEVLTWMFQVHVMQWCLLCTARRFTRILWLYVLIQSRNKFWF